MSYTLTDPSRAPQRTLRFLENVLIYGVCGLSALQMVQIVLTLTGCGDKPTEVRAELTPIFPPESASPLAPAQVLSSGLIGCAAAEIAISEAHRAREGEHSWVASCLGRVLACSALTGSGEGPQRQVYCAERRQVVIAPRPGQDL